MLEEGRKFKFKLGRNGGSFNFFKLLYLIVGWIGFCYSMCRESFGLVLVLYKFMWISERVD